MKTFEKQLPSNYEERLVVDAKDNKTILWINIISILIMIVCIALAFIFNPSFNIIDDYLENDNTLIYLLIFIVLTFIYLILHELTHGIVYNLFAKQKLTLGLMD